MNAEKPTSNVFIADFIDLNDYEFCRTVINLNEKLLLEIKMNDCTSNAKDEPAASENDSCDNKIEAVSNEENGL